MNLQHRNVAKIIKNICCCCLSINRKLTSLVDVADGVSTLHFLLTYDSDAYYSLTQRDTDDLSVCWECKAMMARVCNFRNHACEAQKKLSRIFTGEVKTISRADCLSKLIKYGQIGFNQKIYSYSEGLWSDQDTGDHKSKNTTAPSFTKNTTSPGFSKNTAALSFNKNTTAPGLITNITGPGFSINTTVLGLINNTTGPSSSKNTTAPGFSKNTTALCLNKRITPDSCLDTPILEGAYTAVAKKDTLIPTFIIQKPSEKIYENLESPCNKNTNDDTSETDIISINEIKTEHIEIKIEKQIGNDETETEIDVSEIKIEDIKSEYDESPDNELTLTNVKTYLNEHIENMSKSANDNRKDKHLDITKPFLTLQMTEEEMSESRTKRLECKDFLDAEVKCVHCIERFGNPHQLMWHKKEFHKPNKSLAQCNICKVYMREQFMRYHLNNHYKAYMCRLCNYHGYKGYDILMHLRKQHGSRNFALPILNEPKSLNLQPKRKVAKTTDNSSIEKYEAKFGYLCFKCDRYLEMDHQPETLSKCVVCREVLRFDFLDVKWPLYNECAQYECPSCDYLTFPGFAYFKKHLLQSHQCSGHYTCQCASCSRNKFKCKLCHRKLTSKKSLENHTMRFHREYKKSKIKSKHVEHSYTRWS